MSSVTLKSLLGKRSEIIAWLQEWSEANNSPIFIVDNKQQIVFGSEGDYKETYPIRSGDEELGIIKANSQARLLGELLNLLIQKETEKKKMGTEVLHYYQELNVIYNFSEKLTETIDPDAIAQITLDQATHSIPCDSGVVVVWDELARKLEVPAYNGELLFDRDALSKKSSVLLKIGMNGQSEIMSDISVLIEAGMVDTQAKSVLYAAMKVKQRILGAIILAGKTAEQFTAAHLKLLVTLALQASTAIESALLYEKNIREVREREEAILKIHEVTKKFVPNEFISLLGKNVITDVKLGDLAEKIVTVLFTDIRDFTSLSEKMTPEENFRFVSSFNERLGPVIRKHNGFINQYLGDSIMAIFPGNPENALKAAIDMQKEVMKLNSERKRDGMEPIRAGIGMHTGPLIMGITGDEFRLDAATISDTVNTAARIESLTKYYKSPLLLSGETLNYIPEKNRYDLRFLGEVQLKGKDNVLTIVECINGYPPEVLEIKRKTLEPFRDALAHYHKQRFETALSLFQSILENDPEDYTTSYFIDKARKYSMHGVPENWTGAERMHSK